MKEMYEVLNDNAKLYLTKQLKKNFHLKCFSKQLLKRCLSEIDLLYENNLLFVIMYLYKFKKENENVRYHFKGTTNNLFFLYILDLSYVNPVRFKLPCELFNQDYISVSLVNGSCLSLLHYLDKQIDDFRIVRGFFKKTLIDGVDDVLDNRYLMIPSNYLDSSMSLRFNSDGLLETIKDYGCYKKKYVMVKIDDINIDESKKGINVICDDFEKKLIRVLKPKTLNDYVKIKSISHGTNVWTQNQDVLVKKKQIDINNLIANREDIYEYLLSHGISESDSLLITNFIRKGRASKNRKKWEEYVSIMKSNGCEDMFIDIFSKILFIYGRGEAIGECLLVMNEYN